ncbi:MAG: hypothetical protein JNL19_02005 [Burkholderiales bacterium]|nr:hypothetical protein [Burkholderiales bacterium]
MATNSESRPGKRPDPVTIEPTRRSARPSAVAIFRALAGVLAGCLFATVAPAQPLPAAASLLLNPSFELVIEGKASAPRDWHKAGPGASFAIDADVRRSGERSLRLERTDGTPFTAVSQSLPVAALRGQVVSLRAWLRADRGDAGSGALMLIAQNSERKSVAFVQSEADVLARPGEWQTVEVRLLLPANAEHLTVGFRHAAAGTLWVDDASLSAWPVERAEAPTATAASYLNDAIATIRATALYASRVDWPQASAQARALAAGATTPEATYPAIRYVLRLLADGHSHLVTPAQIARGNSAAASTIAGVTSQRIAGYPLLSIPGFASTDADASAAFANRIRDELATASAGRCGLLLDLRGNTGGNMFPMFSGLTALFADGPVGGLELGDGRRIQWHFVDGKFLTTEAGPLDRADSGATAVQRIASVAAPLAVLLGARTGSSGEAIAIALVGRANTRSFGAPTAGQTTGNRGVTLADGAKLAIASSVMLDRNGKSYGGKLQPDEVAGAAAPAAQPDADPAVSAAITWLNQHPACRK